MLWGKDLACGRIHEGELRTESERVADQTDQTGNFLGSSPVFVQSTLFVWVEFQSVSPKVNVLRFASLELFTLDVIP